MPRKFAPWAVFLVWCMGTSAAALPQDVGDWATYRNPRFGFSISYPADVFRPAPAPANGDGQLWKSVDGWAQLLASAGRNTPGETLLSYRRLVLEKSYPGAVLDYAPVRDTWFVLSGTMSNTIFYERVTFACGGRYIYGWAITYPAAKRSFYDPMVEAIHRSYRPGRGEDGDCR
jgi:hypothetical protein